jgi:tetratricopeptide (TPR) repeat protein
VPEKNDRDLEAAMADTNKAIELDPQSSDAYLTRGMIKAARLEYADAVTDYSQTLTIQPGNTTAFEYRAISKAAQHNLDGAIADYSEAIKLRPDDAFAFQGRGLARAAQGNFNDAVTDYTNAIALKPKYIAAYYARAKAKRALYDNEGATADFQRINDLTPHEAKPPNEEYVQKEIPASSQPTQQEDEPITTTSLGSPVAKGGILGSILAVLVIALRLRSIVRLVGRFTR